MRIGDLSIRYYKVKFQYENELEVRDIVTVRKETRYRGIGWNVYQMQHYRLKLPTQ